MEVYVVIQTSYTPSYGDDSYHTWKSVDQIFRSKEEADKYVKMMTAGRQSVWASEYEVEAHHVR